MIALEMGLKKSPDYVIVNPNFLFKCTFHLFCLCNLLLAKGAVMCGMFEHVHIICTKSLWRGSIFQ